MLDIPNSGTHTHNIVVHVVLEIKFAIFSDKYIQLFYFVTLIVYNGKHLIQKQF